MLNRQITSWTIYDDTPYNSPHTTTVRAIRAHNSLWNGPRNASQEIDWKSQQFLSNLRILFCFICLVTVQSNECKSGGLGFTITYIIWHCCQMTEGLVEICACEIALGIMPTCLSLSWSSLWAQLLVHVTDAGIICLVMIYYSRNPRLWSRIDNDPKSENATRISRGQRSSDTDEHGLIKGATLYMVHRTLMTQVLVVICFYVCDIWTFWSCDRITSAYYTKVLVARYQ